MSFTVWFTGLPNAGKTKLSSHLFLVMRERGIAAELIDSDFVRFGILRPLAFNSRDRDLCVRSIAFAAELLNRNGMVVVVAANNSVSATQREVRESISNYVEVYCKCPLPILEARDLKDVYRKARENRDDDFPGISIPYDEPASPEIVLNTGTESIETCVGTIVQYLENHHLMKP